MSADTFTMLCRENERTVFNVNVRLRAIFKIFVWEFNDFARSLVRNIFILKHWCLCVLAYAALVVFSRVPWLVGVVFGQVLLSWMGVVFGPLLDIWNLFLCLLCRYSNNQNHWSKSGIC